MKILVPVKHVVDYNVRIRVKSDSTGVDLSGVKMAMNPFDEIAIEEALRLKEKGIATSITAISIGDAEVQATLRAALALGADQAIHVETDGSLYPLQIAKILEKIVARNGYDLILMGKQSIDGDHGQTGQMLAAKLGWPQGTFISKLTINGREVQVDREVDGGIETIQMDLPCLLTTDLRLNEPRFATLPNIMKSRKKPLENLKAVDLCVDLTPALTRLKCTAPLEKVGVCKISSIEDIITVIQSFQGGH